MIREWPTVRNDRRGGRGQPGRWSAASPYQMGRASSPARTVVSSETGAHLATFTDGAYTVTLTGAPRTFTEQKPVFADPFDRTVAVGWGTSPNGGVWGNFGGADTDYSMSSSAGRINSPTLNVSRYVRLEDVISTYDVRLAVTTSTTPAGAANSAALIGGWQSTTNHMRYRLTFNSTGGVTASLTKVVEGVETVLAGAVTVAASGYVAGQVWNIRGVFNGTIHGMYAWKDGTTEPTTPTLTATDTTYPTGKLGVRTLASTGATNAPQFQFSTYFGTGLWPTPPAVTHDTWVRLLPALFTGTVDIAWLTAALVDTSPDVLAIAMEYTKGGVFNAEYGPLNADGTRQEGSDWNDYLGVVGNYPDLAVPTTDNPEAGQLGCLDCSGYLRTVMGYRSGMPMCLENPADFNGLRLPRRSVDMNSSGPGVVIASEVGVPPTDLTQLTVGDTLYWDADITNPSEAEGAPDHCGIYLGTDTAVKRRFLSSRKTISGPTLADLGGPSHIEGTGLYARSLRTVRRL